MSKWSQGDPTHHSVSEQKPEHTNSVHEAAVHSPHLGFPSRETLSVVSIQSIRWQSWQLRLLHTQTAVTTLCSASSNAVGAYKPWGWARCCWVLRDRLWSPCTHSTVLCWQVKLHKQCPGMHTIPKSQTPTYRHPRPCSWNCTDMEADWFREDNF